MKFGALVDRREKSVGLLHEGSGQGHAGGIAGHGEEPFLGTRVVEPLDGGAQSILGNPDPDLPRSHLFDRVRLIENDEVVREKVTFLAILLFFRAAEKHEEERVIDHDHVRGEQSPARLLEKAARILSAAFGRAEVRFAANLDPDFRIGLDRQVAQGPVARRPRPIGQAREIGLLGRAEEFVGLLDGALQPARAKIILPAFHERGLELDRQDFFDDRNVLVQELLLQVDRVGRDDRFLLLLVREQHRRHEIGERLADAGAGFDHEVALLLERLRDRGRHRLLLRPILEVAGLREQTVLAKNRPHPLDKIATEGIFERDHAA